jgi:anti-sigma B factor antagonist
VTDDPAQFSVGYEQVADGAATLITISGEVDLGSVSEFEQALDRAAAQGGSLALDMTALRFMDSSGLRAVLISSERFDTDGRRLAIAVTDDSPVRKLFSMSGIEDRLPLFSRRQDALSFAEGTAE